jgi:hypothetical protein
MNTDLASRGGGGGVETEAEVSYHSVNSSHSMSSVHDDFEDHASDVLMHLGSPRVVTSPRTRMMSKCMSNMEGKHGAQTQQRSMSAEGINSP